MATTINGSTGRNQNHWRYYLVVTEQDIDISNNTSKVKVDVYLGATSYSRAVRGNVSAVHTITINGVDYNFTTGAYTIEKNTNYLLGSVTSNAIIHNDDGSKTILISASSLDLAQASGYGPYSGSANGSVTLTTIARASNVTCADGNIGSATTINISRASSNFTHTLKYNFGALSGTIATKTTETSIGWTIPTSFYAQIPNSNSGQGTITCETYNGNTLIGTKNCKFNAFVINSNPTITATITDDNTVTTALTGDANKLVKYFSNAKVVMTATAKNSATIASQKVTCEDGKSSTLATAILNSVESGKFNLSCVDSRGNIGSNSIAKTLIEYMKLAITNLIIERENSTSNTIKINLKGNYFNASFGSVTNTLVLKWRYRIKDGSWSEYATLTAIKNENTFSYNGTLGTNFNYQNAYEFEVVAQDKLMTITSLKPVTAGIPLIDIWKDNININGKLMENDKKLVNQEDFNNRINTLKPVILYDNLSGTTGTVTLSQSAANFNYLKIFFKDDDNEYGYENIYSPNGKYASLSISTIRQNSEGNIKGKTILINGTNITIGVFNNNAERYGELIIGSSNINVQSNNKIYITRVEGYK